MLPEFSFARPRQNAKGTAKGWYLDTVPAKMPS